ncbi:flagellar motor switch protein FliM [Amphibiibacter pelophylacis]|uniref:Flagellar motor switch protein FliM n=1 Tax=Amphibiibacter pelophylacis TaxID=1799477 RepID=A0ACC6P2V4_9BURK
MSQQILSQDEVDALLRGMNGDEADPVATAAPETSAPGEARPVDLANQEKVVRGRMPTLELINERFARNIRSGLFHLTRKNPEISVGAVKVQKYSAFLREMVVPTNFNIVGIRPLRGSGLVVCEPTLIFAIIDALYGGIGKFHTRIEGREFSQTERRVIQRLIEVIIEEYKRSWAGVYPLELEHQRSEMQPQFANIANPSEVVVVTSFNVEIGHSTGSIFFCLPYATLAPIRDVLYSTMHGEGDDGDKRWVQLIRDQLQDAELELVIDLASAHATVEELLAMKPGDFVELDLSPKVKAKVNNVPVFDCTYGTSGGRYAIKIDRQLTAGLNANWLGDTHGY